MVCKGMDIALCLHKYGVALHDPCCYPLGFMYISSVLKQAGHHVKVLNYNLYDYDLEAEIADCQAVLFTGFEEFLPYIQRDAATAKHIGVKTVIGGALATFKTDEMAQICDVVIVGEGEGIVCDAIKSTGVFFGNPISSSLPYPDYQGFGISEYHSRNPYRHIGILTTRGCPYRCTFCAQTCRFKARPVEECIVEMEHYRTEYAPDYVVINDNTFNLSKNRVREFCGYFATVGQKWSAAIRADKFDAEMAGWFAGSNCEKVIIGVESFNQKKLDAMNKQVTAAQIKHALDLLHDNNINYHANLLVGFPGESMADITAEVQDIPIKYNVLPCTVRPFIGNTWGKSDLTPEETTHLNHVFKEYAESRGLTYWT